MERFIEESKEKVLEFLSSMANLPNEGILAGGAVANTILSLLDKKEYPINDIDIFIETDEENSSILRETEKDFIPSSYGPLFKNVDGYKVVSSKNKGLINEIKVKRCSEYKKEYEPPFAQTLIKAFDINQTQVAIDLKTKKIYYTPEFVDFLKKRELKIVFPSTPFHSLVRLIYKSKELNARVNIQKAVRMVSTILALKKTENYPVSNMVSMESRVYKEYLKNKNIVDKYFTVRKTKVENVELLEILPKEPIILQNLKNIFDPIALMVVLNNVFSEKPSDREKYLYLLLYPKITRLINFNPEFAENSSIKTFAKLEEKINQNREYEYLSELLVKMFKLDVEETLQVIDNLTNQETKEMTEMLNMSLTNGNLERLKNMEKSKLIEKLRKNYMKILEEPLTQPFDLSGFELKDKVKELITMKEIKETGEKFRNCLRNSFESYGKDIKDGERKLFVINDTSIVDFAFRKEYEIIVASINQHRSFNNSEPSQEDKKIVAQLFKYINTQIWNNPEKIQIPEETPIPVPVF